MKKYRLNLWIVIVVMIITPWTAFGVQSEDSAWDWMKKGNVYFANKDFANAVDAYSKVIPFEETFVPYFNRGKAYIGLKQYDKALADFQKAASLKPGLAVPYFHQAYMYKFL